MTYSEYNELTLNGVSLTGKEIEQYCLESDSENIRNIGAFIGEWLDDSPFIRVRTSGSTGLPKVIEVRKQQLLQSASATATFFEFKKKQNALLCLPLSFIAGKMMVVRALFSKLNLICVEPGPSPLSSIPTGIVIDFAALTPMQFKDTIHTGAVRKILLGGGPVSPDMEQQYRSLSTEIYHGFGMTETLSHVAIRRVNGVHASAIFQALPGIYFSTDSRGCLVIDAPFLDAPVITNDIVDVVNNQSFQWKGRLDNVINSGGIKLFPEEIEKKLYPLIPGRFFVTGLPDDTYGEKVCLIIEGKPYSPETLSLLQNSLPRYLSKYEKPRAVYFLKKLQTTESGKIQRKENTKMVIQGSTY